MEMSEFIWIGIGAYIQKYSRQPLRIYLGYEEFRQLIMEEAFLTQQHIDYPIHIYGLRIYEVNEQNHLNISD